jgi:tetratricopeptide (TPR) repeat protein
VGARDVTDPYKVLDIAEEADRAERSSRRGGSSGLRQAAGNIPAAVEYLIDNDRAAAMRLVGALSGYWQDAGLVDEGRALTERALENGHRLAGRDADIAAAIPRALLTSSELAFRQADQSVARKRALDAVRAAILVEDRPTAAMAHNNLARIAFRNRDAGEIEAHARKALALAGDDTLARRGALHMLAWAAHTAGDLDEAERRFRESLEYRRRVAGPVSVAVEMSNLADLELERGNVAKAAQLHAEALEVSHRSGSVYMLVNGLPSFAALALHAGLAEDAARLLGAAQAIAAAAGLTPDPGSELTSERAGLEEQLGAERYMRLVAAGAALSADEAVDLAKQIAGQIGE